MGGCRCSYRNCEKASNNCDSNFHFFHYPVKDPCRCDKWIENAKKPEFRTYSVSKLRNKVICELHFEYKCFTNVLRKRLVHDAVPTLAAGTTWNPTQNADVTLRLTHNDTDCTVFSLTPSSEIPQKQSVQSYIIQDGDVIPVSEKLKNIKTELPSSPVANEPILPEIQLCELESTNDSVVVNDKNLNEIETVNNQCEDTNNVLETFNKRITMLENRVRLNKKTCRRMKRLSNGQILQQLHNRLPSSLRGIVSLHLYKRKGKYSKREEDALVKLYQAAPATYTNLRTALKWKLPRHDILQNIILNLD